jgi:hypothetical protein
VQNDCQPREWASSLQYRGDVLLEQLLADAAAHQLQQGVLVTYGSLKDILAAITA